MLVSSRTMTQSTLVRRQYIITTTVLHQRRLTSSVSIIIIIRSYRQYSSTSSTQQTKHSSILYRPFKCKTVDITYLLTCLLTYLLAVNFSSSVLQSAAFDKVYFSYLAATVWNGKPYETKLSFKLCPKLLLCIAYPPIPIPVHNYLPLLPSQQW